MDLERHDDLFTKDYKHVHLDENGKVEKEEGPLDCMYKGSTLEDPEALVSVSFCEGVVHATVYLSEQQESFSVMPLRDVSGHAEHVVYRHRDLKPVEAKCGVDDHDEHVMATTAANADLRRRLDEIVKAKGHVHEHDHAHDHDHVSHSNARSLGTTLKQVGVAVVNDNARYRQKGLFTHLHSATLMATAASLYRKLGPTGRTTTCNFFIELQISSMITFSKSDPYTPTLLSGQADPNSLLTSFEDWRASTLAITLQGHDIAHLLSGIKFQGVVIGLASVYGVCASSQRSGITQANTIGDSQIASTITHEIGHNFGSSHTQVVAPTLGYACNPAASGKFYIMSASSSSGNTDWEACTADWFNEEFKALSPTYDNVPNQYTACAEAITNPLWNFTQPVCGDGIVEGAEECDCVNNNCASGPNADSCCIGATCRLAMGNTCSPIHDGCCTASCQIDANATRVCRTSSSSQCDTVEYCTGSNKKCPADVFSVTGTTCTTNLGTTSGTCFFKKCLDVKDQCMAQTSVSWVDVCTGLRNNGNCEMQCKTAGGTCQFFTPANSVFWSDGTKCSNGNGCYRGACIAFSSIPTPNCTIADYSNISSIDCGSGGDATFGSSQPRDYFRQLLTDVWAWMQANLYIWVPCAAVGLLLFLFCCCVPRGSNPPIAKAGMQRMGNSFRRYDNRNDNIPTAYKA